MKTWLPFHIPTKIVHSLVDDFLTSYKGRTGFYCSKFDKEMMKLHFQALKESKPGHISYNDVSAVIMQHHCCKLAANCNSWTPWMLERLKQTKRRIKS